jgi:hypothetical protein
MGAGSVDAAISDGPVRKASAAKCNATTALKKVMILVAALDLAIRVAAEWVGRVVDRRDCETDKAGKQQKADRMQKRMGRMLKSELSLAEVQFL